MNPVTAGMISDNILGPYVRDKTNRDHLLHQSRDHGDRCTYNSNKDKYHRDTTRNIQIAYILGAIIWIIIVFCLNIKQWDFIIALFLVGPLIVFAINYWNLDNLVCRVEQEMFKGNFLQFGFLITVILINWNPPSNNADKVSFFKLIIVAFILLMLSIVDIWVDEHTLSLVKHIRSMFQTAALSILVVALYIYFRFHQSQIVI